jgi:preprotein translocase subunit SecD
MHQRFTIALAILLFVSVGLACSLLRPKSALTWHILIEIDVAAPDREAAVKRTVSVIERRLDAFGLNNYQVLAQGTPPNGRILVSLPEVTDRERLKALITAGGLLELTAVVSFPNPSPVQTYSTKEEAVASLGGTVPGNRRVLPYSERDEPTTGKESPGASEQAGRWVVVESPSIVDGSELRNAAAVQSPGSDETYQIAFSLGPEGSQKFGAWTGAHINNYIGVVLNGKVKSIAFIKSQIFDQGEISGRFTKHSAEDLALILRSGALPAPVKIIETGDNK